MQPLQVLTPGAEGVRAQDWPHISMGGRAVIRCGKCGVTAPERGYVQNRCPWLGLGPWHSVTSSIIDRFPHHQQAPRNGTVKGDIKRFESRRETCEDRA